MTEKERQLLGRIEPLLAEDGIEVVTVEVVGAKKSPVVRVYIDTASGVSFDELSSAQSRIGKLLDEIDPFPGAYTLEVSSPGIDRPLRTPEHFDRFAGEQVRLKLKGKIDGASKLKGRLKGFEDGSVILVREEDEKDQVETRVPMEDIKGANVIGVVEF